MEPGKECRSIRGWARRTGCCTRSRPKDAFRIATLRAGREDDAAPRPSRPETTIQTGRTRRAPWGARPRCPPRRFPWERCRDPLPWYRPRGPGRSGTEGRPRLRPAGMPPALQRRCCEKSVHPPQTHGLPDREMSCDPHWRFHSFPGARLVFRMPFAIRSCGRDPQNCE